MPLQDQLITVSSKGFLKRISDDLFQGIKKVYNTDPSERRRWIWELIQNAKDTPNEFGAVSIKIQLSENELIFSHNGNPFSVENIVGIIQQVSTKSSKDDNETTGKFGTGFITTHMLSRIIYVTGYIVYDSQFKEFTFELNRDAETQELLLEKVEDQIRKLHLLPDDGIFPPKPISNLIRNENSFNTVFKYPLSENSLKYAQQGIEDLKASAHFALLFNNKIKQFEIQDDITKENFKICRVANSKITEFIYDAVTRIEHNNNSKEYHLLHFKSENEFDIAIPVGYNSYQYEVLIPNISTPRIFKDFPLIGTENWGSNFIFNSRKFQPTESRDGLELHIEEDAPKTEQILNREIMQSIYNCFPLLISQLASLDSRISKIHILCESSVLSNKSHRHEDIKIWLKDTIQIPFRKQLKDLPIVKTSDGYKSISKCKFPDFTKADDKNIKYYEICSKLIKHLIPEPDCYPEWHTIIKGDANTWGEGLLFSLDDLVALIENKKTLLQFTEFNERSLLIDWLNTVYAFIEENDKTDLYKHLIVPNQEQEGSLNKTTDLSIDEGIPDLIKDYSQPFGIHYRKILANKRVICTQVQKRIGISDVSKEVNQRIGLLTQGINPKTGQHGITDPVKISLIQLCSIFPNADSDSKRKGMLVKLKKFYSDTSGITFDEKVKDYEFGPSLKCLTKFALLQLSQLGTVNKLQLHLKLETEVETIMWLNSFLLEINGNSDLNEFLNQFGVFPNQTKEFSFRNKLSQDVDAIEETLKSVYSSLYPNDLIKSRLLLDGIGVYPDSKVTFSEIASKIDNGILEQEKTIQKTIILQMINWCKSHPIEEEQFFKLLKSNKARLVLQTIEGENAQEHIFRILQSNQDYNKLACIAESGADIDKVSDIIIISKANSIDLKDILNIIKMAGTVGISIIESFAAEKYEEELDRQFKEALGANIELSFTEAFERHAINIQIIRDPLGQDFTLILPSGKNHKVEIKSIAKGSKRVLLSKLQGKVAANNIESYTLCVMERPVGNLYPNKAEFESISRYVMDIGNLIKDKVNFANSIEGTLTDFSTSNINLVFEDFNYKFSVDRTVWENNLSMSDFVERLISGN